MAGEMLIRIGACEIEINLQKAKRKKIDKLEL
jgi:hypothetical protein